MNKQANNLLEIDSLSSQKHVSMKFPLLVFGTLMSITLLSGLKEDT